MSAIRRPNVKMLAAVIGGSAVVAAGAVTMAISQEQAAPSTFASSGMTVDGMERSCQRAERALPPSGTSAGRRGVIAPRLLAAPDTV